jgi:dihydrofolate reductase
MPDTTRRAPSFTAGSIAGSADLVHTLMQHDLIDEYRLMVHPVVPESGKRLFRDGSDKKVLRLVETKTFSSSVVVFIYQPDRKELKIVRSFTVSLNWHRVI